MKRYFQIVSLIGTFAFGSFLSLPSFSQIKTLSAWDLNANGQPGFINLHTQAGFFSSSGFSEPLSFSEKGAYISKWPLASASSSEDSSKYFEITLGPNANFPIKITEIHFFERRSSTGIRDYKVKYSLDNFQTDSTIADVHVPDNDSARNGKIENLEIIIPVSGTLSIRWYAYNSEALNGTWRIESKSLFVKGMAIGAPFTESTLDTLPKFDFTDMGSYSNLQSFYISADNLIDDVTISVDPNFEISSDSTNWNSMLTLNHSGNGSLINQPALVYCRFSPANYGLISGEINVLSANAMPTIIKIFGQGVNPAISTETFENIPHNLAYGNYSWIGDNGDLWEVEDALLNKTINTTKAVTIKNGKLKSPLLQNGINSLTLTTQNLFLSAESGSLIVKINGNSVGTIPFSSSQETTTINDINISGDFIIEIEQPHTDVRVTIDDLIWTAIPTNITLLYFKADLKEKVVSLNWELANGNSIKSFEVQKSNNGKEFFPLGMLSPENPSLKSIYEFKDVEINNEKLFYRLKIQELSGKYSFSDIVEINSHSLFNSFELIANLVKDYLPIQIHSKLPFHYSITGLTGRSIIIKKETVHFGKLNLDVRYLTPGLYLLNIYHDQDISQFKFVKE